MLNGPLFLANTGYIACSPDANDSALYVFLDDSGFTFMVTTNDGGTFVCGGPTCSHSTTPSENQVSISFANGEGLTGTIVLNRLLLKVQPVLTVFASAAQVDVQTASGNQSRPVSEFESSNLNCRFGSLSETSPAAAADELNTFVLSKT
jgi:hypothetical protein